MAKNKLIYVKIVGTAINEKFQARSHELLGLPAGTYHKFLLENGAMLFFNDFGIRSIVIADDPGELDN